MLNVMLEESLKPLASETPMAAVNVPHAPIPMFDECAPVEFQRDTLRCLLQDYKAAYDGCRQDFDAPEAHDLRGHVRRAMFDRDWRTLARRYGAHATAETNAGNNCYHTRIVMGRAILTSSMVDAPTTLPRQASFRETYARTRQLTLFGTDAPPPIDAPLYAILVHGPGPDDPSRPAFAFIGFPSPDCNEWVDKIDLFGRFHELLAPASQVEAETIEDIIQPQLRVRKETGSA